MNSTLLSAPPRRGVYDGRCTPPTRRPAEEIHSRVLNRVNNSHTVSQSINPRCVRRAQHARMSTRCCIRRGTLPTSRWTALGFRAGWASRGVGARTRGDGAALRVARATHVITIARAQVPVHTSTPLRSRVRLPGHARRERVHRICELQVLRRHLRPSTGARGRPPRAQHTRAERPPHSCVDSVTSTTLYALLHSGWWSIWRAGERGRQRVSPSHHVRVAAPRRHPPSLPAVHSVS